MSDVMHLSGWEKWHAFQAGVMTPVVDWYVSAIAARPGLEVLDAASGTGLPALAIAARVAPGGRVVATDVAPVMVDALRRKAAASGLANVDARVMPAEHLDLPDATFDAVTCKDGLMYCADPLDGARELARVLRPGGRLAVSAWDLPAANPFFTTMFGTVAPFLGRPAPDPDAPGPFRLARPGRLEEVLRAAGLDDVKVERRELVWDFESVEQHWALARDTAAPVEAAASSLGADELARLRAALAAALEPFAKGGRVRIPGVVLCASGTRS